MRAYLQLVRLPNVFTAMADILLGFLFTHERLEPWPQFALLLAASTLLYLVGHGAQRFVRPRARRPRAAVSADPLGPRERWPRPGDSGSALLAGGVALGWAATAVGGRLAARRSWPRCWPRAIVAYDGVLKRTPLGPPTMGACRVLNVLLGMSLADGPWAAGPLGRGAVASASYIVGVTIFARTEARASGRPQLALGVAVIVAGWRCWRRCRAGPAATSGPPIDVPDRVVSVLGIAGAADRLALPAGRGRSESRPTCKRPCATASSR